MGKQQKLKGRPALSGGKRSRKIDVRFTEDEFKIIEGLEKELGISRTELVRMRVLGNGQKAVVNARELITKLDSVGTELARAGNNINQLARYGNIMQLKEVLDPGVAGRFNELLNRYVEIQQALDVSIRKIIREMGR